MFVLANMAAAVAMALLSMLAWEALYSINPMGFRGLCFDQLAAMGILALGYMAFYLGLGKLILAWLRHTRLWVALSSVLVHVLLVLLGCGVPLVIHLMSDFRMSGYNLLHVFNPFWSMAELVGRVRGAIYGTGVLYIVCGAGFVMICLNLRSVMEEIRLVRMASPTRVAEEEALVAALTAPPVHVPLSPWDEEGQTDPST